MSERDEKRGGLGCAITGIVLILLPVLYVLSIGPAAWLDDRSPGGIYVLRAAYAPLLYIMEHCRPVGEAIDWYIELGR